VALLIFFISEKAGVFLYDAQVLMPGIKNGKPYPKIFLLI
jgi:hypothetical protein